MLHSLKALRDTPIISSKETGGVKNPFLSSIARLKLKPAKMVKHKRQMPRALFYQPPSTKASIKTNLGAVQKQLGRAIARQQEKVVNVSSSPDYYDGWTPVIKKTF